MDPLEFLYYTGYRLKKSLDMKRRKRLPARVVSVGNITVGGTGKTPAVIALAEKAKGLGYQPCILTRGYRGRVEGPCFVKGPGVFTVGLRATGSISLPRRRPHILYGDEPVLMAGRLKDVPVVKCADRYEGGMFALKDLPSNTERPLLFILDDGYQHWRLSRDKDILLIDGTNPFGNRKLLPSGILREPLGEMKRADLIVITRMPLSDVGGEKNRVFYDDLINEIRDNNPDAPLYVAQHQPAALVLPSGLDGSVKHLEGSSVVAFCGIGNPDSFKETITSLGAEVKRFYGFSDHFEYGRKDLSRVLRAAKKHHADWIVTTEKDIMKLTEYALPENLISLRIEFRVDDGFYENVFRGLDRQEAEWSSILM